MEFAIKAKNILLTGSPGCGKTSLIKEVLGKLKSVKAGGFFTSEIREKGVRKGFKITSLDGEEAILAHVDFKGPHKVSKYTVSIENLERVGLRALQRAIDEADLIVIDEIGKMELYSEAVREAILATLESDKKVLGTIMQAPHPFANKIKIRKDTVIIEVSRNNWAEVLKEILSKLESSGAAKQTKNA